MSNIALRGDFDLASLNDIDTYLINVQQAMSSVSTEPFLRLDKGGKWIFGADSVEVEPKAEWAIHPLSVRHGYVCWNKMDTGQKKLGEVMVPFTQPKPDLLTLPEHPGSPWAEQTSFSLVCISGQDAGTQVKYATASMGGSAQVKERLLPTMIKRIIAEKQKGPIDEDRSEIVPVVLLESDYYIHEKWGKTHKPIFTILRWGTLKNQDAKPTRAAAKEEETVTPMDAPRRRMRQRA